MTVSDSQSVDLARFREVRERIERAVLPLSTSLDGRRFSFQASLYELRIRLGGYVTLETSDGRRLLGQIVEMHVGRQGGTELTMPGDEHGSVRADVVLRHVAGEGVIVEGDGEPFHDALLAPAEPAVVAAWVERRTAKSAALEIGGLALSKGVPGRIDARGFDRHTFLCGQSGSGKTYSLGVVLERLLMATTLRIVILDPNSDFVRLGTVSAGADPAAAAAYERVAGGVQVHSARAGAAERLRLRVAELDAPAQAALLHLDPVADREEHAELEEMLASGQPPLPDALERTGRPAARALAMRARSLGLDRLGVWAGEETGSVFDPLGPDAPRCLVVDLGSLPTHTEQALVAQAVLGELWRRREERRPVLIVIDEAHNVCPAHPDDGLTALGTEHAVRIAAEGRKFGLHLLVSTQRPQKVHENVVSQCDNLMLMRLNSSADTALLREIFSFVPAGLIDLASGFGLGEALLAGKIAPYPALLKFGARVAEEGGGDVGTSWAAAP